MTGQTERSLEELYRDDPERADALVFGRVTEPSRRGFLNGAGLAAMGAAVGGAVPFAANMPGGLIPAAMAQGAPAAPLAPAKKGPTYLQFPGKDDKLVVLGDKPLVAETPEASARRRQPRRPTKFFIRNNGQIPEESQGRRLVEDHHRRRGQQQARADAWRAEVEVQAGDAAHGAGMRRQRPLVLHADRRAAISGPTAAPAAPNGPACGSPTCSRPPA